MDWVDKVMLASFEKVSQFLLNVVKGPERVEPGKDEMLSITSLSVAENTA